MVSATQSLTPDPVHGDPKRSIRGSFRPQTWNRYPYVINDPMTKIDPLGGSHQDYDPYFVGCFPDPFFESLFGGFGCGYSAESRCPPGFEEIYGDRRPGGGPAIESINSLHNYANAVLPWGNGFGTNYGFTNTPAGVDFWISGDWIGSLLGVDGNVDNIFGSLSSIDEIAALAGFIAELEKPGSKTLKERIKEILIDVWCGHSRGELAIEVAAEIVIGIVWGVIVATAPPVIALESLTAVVIGIIRETTCTDVVYPNPIPPPGNP